MECGDCTLCCDMFPVKWLNKPANTKCIHCNLGCEIHETKEAECKDFDCMYAQVESVPLTLRPDKSGIIFEKISDTIIYGTVNHKKDISDIGKEQVYKFKEQGFSVILASIKKRTNKFVIADKHDENNIRTEFHNYLTNKYGHIRN